MKRGNHLVQIEGLQANLPVSRKMSNKAPTEGRHAYTHTCTGPIHTYTRFGPPSQRGEGCVGGRASRNKQNAVYLSHPAPDRVAKQGAACHGRVEWKNALNKSTSSPPAVPPCGLLCPVQCNAPTSPGEGGREKTSAFDPHAAKTANGSVGSPFSSSSRPPSFVLQC